MYVFFTTANYIIGSQIAIGEGLYLAKTEINGHPSENNLKVWLFSGGKNNYGRDPEYEANELKKMGGKLSLKA